MRQMPALVFALAWSIAVTAWARGPNVDGVRSYELPAYTIITADPAAALAATRAVAQADGILGKLLPRVDAGRNAPTMLVMLPSSIWSRYLAPGAGVTAQFVPAPFANYIEVSFGGDLGRGVIHEYTHDFLHTQFSGLVPLWFDEGVAQFVAAATIQGETATLGEIQRTQTYVPGMGGLSPRDATDWMPMATLLGLDGRSRVYRDTRRSHTVHKQAWIMVHRGLAADPAHFGRQMYALLAAQDELVSPEVAIPKIFGESTAEFDLELHAYSKGPFATRDLAVGPIEIPELPGGRDLPAIELLELIAEMMMASGYNLDLLGEITDAMQVTAPGSAVARAWRMRLAARRTSGAALDQLVHGLNAHSDPRLLRGAGLAFFERALAKKADARPDNAFKLLDLATASRPGDAEAVWAYATLAAGLKRDLPIARQRLEVIRAAWPANADLAMAAAQVYEALGETEQAREALLTTRRLAKRPEMIRWATQKLRLAGS